MKRKKKVMTKKQDSGLLWHQMADTWSNLENILRNVLRNVIIKRLISENCTAHPYLFKSIKSFEKVSKLYISSRETFINDQIQ